MLVMADVGVAFSADGVIVDAADVGVALTGELGATSILCALPGRAASSKSSLRAVGLSPRFLFLKAGLLWLDSGISRFTLVAGLL